MKTISHKKNGTEKWTANKLGQQKPGPTKSGGGSGWLVGYLKRSNKHQEPASSFLSISFSHPRQQH
jgi:hypothetical protein